MYKMKVEIIPFVLTWDGMVTKFNKDYRKILDIDDRILGYNQSNVMKRTFELLVNDTIRFNNGRIMNYEDFDNLLDDLDFNYHLKQYKQIMK